MLGMSVHTVKTIAFWAFVIAFAVKVPIWPFHTWLPDAHTEAPTAGSMILAGVLLKLGAYGFLRLVLPLYPVEAKIFAGALAVLATAAIVFGAFGCLRPNGLQATRGVFIGQPYGLCRARYRRGRLGVRNDRCAHRHERRHPADVQSWTFGGWHVLPGRRDL